MGDNYSRALPNVRLFSVLCASIESSWRPLYRHVIDRETVIKNKSRVRSQVHTEHPQSTWWSWKAMGSGDNSSGRVHKVMGTLKQLLNIARAGSFCVKWGRSLPGWCKDLRMDKLRLCSPFCIIVTGSVSVMDKRIGLPMPLLTSRSHSLPILCTCTQLLWRKTTAVPTQPWKGRSWHVRVLRMLPKP